MIVTILVSTSTTSTMATITSDTTNSTIITIVIIITVVFLLVVVVTCSVVFIVIVKKTKSFGGMPEETTDGGIDIKNNEAYGIVNQRGEGRGGEGERGGENVELVRNEAYTIVSDKMVSDHEYENNVISWAHGCITQPKPFLTPLI